MGTNEAEEAPSSENEMETGPLPSDSMGALVSLFSFEPQIKELPNKRKVASIFDEVFQNIIYDTVSEAHREEKRARMRSAVILAEEAVAAQQAATGATPQKENATPTSATTTGFPVFPGKVETPGAIYDNGQITLIGNPLETTKDVICPRCRLPQLQYPTKGEGARVPDPTVKYCKLQPFVKMAGHDIHGKPFPSNNVSAAKLRKEKKEKEVAAAKAQSQAEQASANGSIDTPNGTPPPNSDSKGTKVTSYPHVKCPVCLQHKQVTRFAKHLDQCMGISGRQSSRNAMAKIEASQGTPSGSRTGTPVPGSRSSPSKRNRDDDDDEEEQESDETPKKKKKKLIKKPLEKISAKPKPSKLKDGAAAGESLPTSSQTSQPRSVESKSFVSSQESSKPKVKSLEKSFSESGQSLSANGLIGTTKKLKRLNEASTPTKDKFHRDSMATNGTPSPKTESLSKSSPAVNMKSKVKAFSPLVTTKERADSISPSKPPENKASNGTLKKRKREEQLHNGSSAGDLKDRDAFQKKKQKQLNEGSVAAAAHTVEA